MWLSIMSLFCGPHGSQAAVVLSLLSFVRCFVMFHKVVPCGSHCVNDCVLSPDVELNAARGGVGGGRGMDEDWRWHGLREQRRGGQPRRLHPLPCVFRHAKDLPLSTFPGPRGLRSGGLLVSAHDSLQRACVLEAVPSRTITHVSERTYPPRQTVYLSRQLAKGCVKEAVRSNAVRFFDWSGAHEDVVQLEWGGESSALRFSVYLRTFVCRYLLRGHTHAGYLQRIMLFRGGHSGTAAGTRRKGKIDSNSLGWLTDVYTRAHESLSIKIEALARVSGSIVDMAHQG